MRTVRVLGLVGLLLVGSVTSSAAQESGDVGLSMGYPSTIAVIWHISDRVAIRPEVSLDWTSTEIELGLPIEGDTSTDLFATNVGASILFYLGAPDRLRTYVSPRILYSRVSTDTEASFTADIDRTLDGFLASGSFGAQYAVSDRFTAFGEVGFQYSRASSTIRPTFGSTAEGTVRSLGVRTAVGVTLYF